MAFVDQAAVRALFDRVERVEAEPFGVRREVGAHVVRHVGHGDGPSWIIASDLAGADVDAVIRAEIDRFDRLGRSFEWKHYDHDQPADLRDRLLAAGFEAGDEEALLVLDLRSERLLDVPSGARVVAGGEDRLGDLLEVAEGVWPEHLTWMRDTLSGELADAASGTRLFVAYEGERPVSAGWNRRTPGSPFVGMYGAATVPDARGRGHYRALVAARAHDARGRGARYLAVEAGPMSLPILARLGFVRVATTTPFEWRPLRRHSAPPA